jgi:hypothetical protein
LACRGVSDVGPPPWQGEPLARQARRGLSAAVARPQATRLARIFHECYAAARHGVRWAERVAAEAEIPAWARNTPLPP